MNLLRRFWTDFVRAYRWWYALGIFFLICTNVLTVSIPKFIEQAIDALDLGHAESAPIRYACAIIISGLGIIIVRTLSRTLFFNPGRTIEYDVKTALFQHLLKQPQAFFDKTRPGDLISRGTNDVNSMRALIGFGTLQLFNVIFVLTLTLGQMLWMDTTLTLLVLIPLSLGGVIMGIAVKQLFTMVVELLSQLGLLSDRILESYAGAAVIQSYNAFAGAYERFDARNDEFLDISLKILRIRAFLMPIVALMGQVCVVLVLFVGGQKVLESETSFTIGKLSAFIAYITILVNGLKSLGFLVGATQRGFLALERIYEILDTPSARATPSQSQTTKNTEDILELKHLSFTYPNCEKPTLNDISLTIKRGETLGIFGVTGSGKTTLMSVLARIYDPDPNQIFLRGVDVLDYPIEGYWQQVALARQSPFLFSQTLEKNIAIQSLEPSDINRANLNTAVQDAVLLDEIQNFRDGLRTRVGERGVTLSGGQRQRTALARIFYRDFDIILLDDVMSAVDHATETKLIDAVYRRETSVKLIVSHRTSVLARADRIVVLEDGKLIDEGDHQSLTLRPGPYQKAYRLQQHSAEAPA